MIKKNNNMNFFRKLTILSSNSIFLLIFLAMLIKTIILINKVPLEFDGSFNLQIPLNLVNGNGYTTFTGTFRQFNYQITTGFPVLLPVAAIFKLFGIGVVQSRVITILFYFALIYALYLITKEFSNKWIALLPPVLFFLISDPTRTTVNAYTLIGEIPALFFSLLGFYFINHSLTKQKNHIIFSVFAGFSFSLAYFAKSLFIMVVPAIVIVFLYAIFIKKQKKHILTLSIILIIMILSNYLWDLHIMNAIGDRYADYVFWRKNYLIYGGSGVTEDGFLFSLNALGDKLSCLNENLGLRFRWIFLISLGLMGAFCVRLYQDKVTYIEMAITIFVLIYFFWWFGIANNIVYRHVLPAIILCFPLLSSIFILINDLVKPQFQKIINYSVIGFSILCVLVILLFQKVPQYNDLSAQKEFASELNLYQNQIVFEGWWQNPEIAFLQQKGYLTIDEYKSSGNTEDPILIFTNIQKNGDFNNYLEITSKCKKIIVEVDDLKACLIENY